MSMFIWKSSNYFRNRSLCFFFAFVANSAFVFEAPFVTHFAENAISDFAESFFPISDTLPVTLFLQFKWLHLRSEFLFLGSAFLQTLDGCLRKGAVLGEIVGDFDHISHCGAYILSNVFLFVCDSPSKVHIQKFLSLNFCLCDCSAELLFFEVQSLLPLQFPTQCLFEGRGFGRQTSPQKTLDLCNTF